MVDLTNRTAIVTGAARGIGRAIVEAYVARGARVGMVDVLADDLQKSSEAVAATGGRVRPVVADITDPSQVDAMVEEVESHLGPVDILVNNAGTFSYIGPLWEADPATWFRDIRVNLYGGFLCCRSVVRRMVARGDGYVINMVSSGGVGDPHPHSTSYASSKAALMRLTEGLAQEVRSHGIKVFTLAPPAVRSEMTRFIAEDPAGQKWRPAFGQSFKSSDNWTPPERIAEWCVELVSGRIDALTGRYIPASKNPEDIIRDLENILQNDRLTLRIRKQA